MNFKKIGLTALAGSLVATSVVTTAVVAAEMAVTGSASVKVRSVQKGSAGKAYSMGNQLEFAGSGEMDNGLDVKLSFVLDQNDDTGTDNNLDASTTGGASRTAGKGSPFDSHSVSIGNDALGTLVFHGEGGSSAQSAMDTTAAGDLWDNGYGISTSNDPSASLTTNNMIFYTLPEISDGLALTTSFVPRGAGAVDPSLAYGISYTGVEGLTLNFAQGENNATSTNTADATTMHVKYAIGSFTVGYSDTEYDATATASDKDVTSMNLSYTVSEDFSVSYGQDEIARPGVGGDQDIKVTAISGSYTAGGMTLGAMVGDSENTAHGTSAAQDKGMFHLTAAFAF
jgi:outer membrane protein OmpU